jgi:hypothetical protein
VLSICTAPRDELRFPGYLTGLLTIRPHTQSLPKKGRSILHPLGSLMPGLWRRGSTPSRCPSWAWNEGGPWDRDGGAGRGSGRELGRDSHGVDEANDRSDQPSHPRFRES